MSTASKLDFTALNANKNGIARNYWKDRMNGLEWQSWLEARQDSSDAAGAEEYTIYTTQADARVAAGLRHIASSPKARHILLLSALGILLEKYSSLSDVVVFTPLYTDSLSAGMGGSRVGSGVVPVRMTDFGGSFAGFLNRFKGELLRDLGQGNYPLDKILGLPDHEIRALPLIGLFLEEIQEWPYPDLAPGILFHFGTGEGLTLTIKYDRNKFDPAYVANIAVHYFQLLSRLMEDREKRIPEIELITGKEKHTILSDFNNTDKPFGRDKTLLDLFAAQVLKNPAHIAVQCQGQRLTYRELDLRSNQVAHYVRQHVSGKGTIVGVQSDRSVELMIILYGILKAGCVYLPLTRDYPVERIRYILQSSGAELLFTDNAGLLEPGEECKQADRQQAFSCSQEAINRAQPEDMAYIIYTSGSTGHPKGVLIRHRSIVNRLGWMQDRYRLDEKDVILQKTPIVFDVSVWELFWMCWNGARLVLAPPDAEKDPAAICQTIVSEKITVLHFVPSMLNVFLNYLSENKGKKALPDVKQVFASGEELSPVDAQLFYRLCPQATLYNLYGPTEATVDVSFHRVDPTAFYRRIPIGKPIDNTQLYIFNKELNLQPIGIPGELFIGGENLSVGYLNQPELTSGKFITNPFDSASVLYRTGDLARWLPDGAIEFLGRIDDQVKIRGNRIEISEIEHAISAFVEVRSAVVLTKRSGGILQLIAFVAASPEFSEEALRAYLKAKLPEYMMPAYFIRVEHIPQTVNGKADKKKLLSLERSSGSKQAPAVSAMEKWLFGKWKEVLGQGNFGIDDSFFRIGGDSILAVKLVGALNGGSATLNNDMASAERIDVGAASAAGYEGRVDIAMADLYNNDTIRRLASLLEQAPGKENPEKYTAVGKELQAFDRTYRDRARNGLLEAAYLEAAYPMSQIEKAMWYIHQSRPDDILYFEQIMQPVTYERLDIAVLQRALDLLVRKHETLRTGFDLGESAHLVFKEVKSDLLFYDLSLLAPDKQKRTIEEYLVSSRARHFHPQELPLWRMIVYKLREDYHELLFEYHHAIIDGWSFASLITELNNTYVGLLKDPSFTLQPLAAGYKDFILQELFAQQDPETLQYWRTSLQGAKKLRLNTVSDTRQFRSVRESYPSNLVADLTVAANQRNTTIKSLLLAAYVYAIGTLAGESDVTVGLVTFTRPLKEDGEKLLGCFLNTIPFRVQIPESLTWADYIGLIDARLLELRKYEHLSLFEINQAIGSRTDEGNPLFDTLFNFINWHVEKEMKLEKMSDSALDRLEFDSFLRGHTFFDANYNVNAERIYCMHEYSSPFMNEESFADYTAIFNQCLSEILENPDQRIDAGERYWSRKSAEVYKALDEYSGGDTGREGMTPASFQQERIWPVKDSTACHIPLLIDLEGPVDANLLQSSLRAIIDRQEALRSQFVSTDGNLFFNIAPAGDFVLGRVDWRADRAAVSKWLTAEISRPFDPNGLLIRATLLQTGPAVYQYQLVILLHSLIADSYSSVRLAEELLRTYRALLRQEKPELPEAPVSYQGYCWWQRRCLLKLEPRIAAFRRSRQQEELTPLAFPTDSLPDPLAASVRRSVELSVDPRLTEKVQAYARQSGVGPSTVFLAALHILLSNYAQQEEIVVYTMDDNRYDERLKALTGPLSSVIAVKSCVSPTDAVDGYIRSFPERYPDGADYQAGKATTDFTVFYKYDDHRLSIPGIDGLQIDVSPITDGYGPYELTLLLWEKGLSLQGRLLYNAGHFEPPAMTSLVARYYQLLEQLVDRPQARISELKMVLPEEKRRLLHEWNATAAPYPSEKTMIDLFEEQVERTPENSAVRFGEQVLSYSQLQQQMDTIAWYLETAAGVAPGQLVGVLLEREEYLVPSLFGIWKAGAAYVPIDPHYPAGRIASILEDAGVTVVITRGRHLEGLEGGLMGDIRFIDLDKVQDEIAAMASGGNTAVPSSGSRPSKARSGEIAYVIYTSGSTGRPKGVMIEHGSVVNRLWWMQQSWPLGPEDVLLQKTPIVFDVSVWELFWWSLAGASLCVLEPGAEKDPAELSAVIEKRRVTTLHFVPSMLGVFLSGLEGRQDWSGLRSLRRVFASGEALTTAQVRSFGASVHRHCGTALINLYGPTEATVDVSVYACTFQEQGRPIPIGRPISNIRLYVLDREGRLSPVGVPGELCIGGVGLARGYLNNPGLTAEKFVVTGLEPAERLYRTGDWVRWREDGHIEFLGRIDHQVKLRGYRIELGEIESRLQRQTGIRESVVVLQEGGGDGYLVAYYTGDGEKETVELRDFLSAELPGYMVPSLYVYVPQWPLTVNGKLDRRALPQPVLATTESPAVTPGGTEENLIRIWSSILQLDKNKIGEKDDFFLLGGHSIRAIHLMNRIYAEFSVQVRLKDIFVHSSVKKLALLIENSLRETRRPLVKAEKAEFYPASFAQERLFFEFLQNSDSLAYNITGAFRLGRHPDTDQIKIVFQSLIDRHEGLRTRFMLLDEGVVQQPLPVMEAVVETVVLDGDNDLRQAYRDFVRPFDLSSAPLIRIRLVRQEGKGTFLFLDVHHIICDGVSLNILMNDFRHLFHGRPLPPLPLTYTDYACWQKDPAANLAAQKRFWMRQLAGEWPELDLPVIQSRELVDIQAAGLRILEIDAALYQEIKQFAAGSNVSEFMLLLSVCYILLSRMSGNTDIIIATDVIGRTHPDLKDIVGTFVNILPLRLQLQPETPYLDFLKEVRTCVLDAFDNQDFPFDQMVPLLKKRDGISRRPVLPFHFSLINFFDDRAATDEAEFEPLDLKEKRTTQYEFKIEVATGNDGLSIKFIYSRELYAEDTIHAFMGYYYSLLRAVLRDPSVIPEHMETDHYLPYAPGPMPVL